MAILSAAAGDKSLAEKYLEIAEKGAGLRYRSLASYPFFNLIHRHDCGFVRQLLGVTWDGLSDDWIKLLKGYSHCLAAHVSVLRNCQGGIQALVEMSTKWPKIRLNQNQVEQRLKALERRLLDKAGTIFAPV